MNYCAHNYPVNSDCPECALERMKVQMNRQRMKLWRQVYVAWLRSPDVGGTKDDADDAAAWANDALKNFDKAFPNTTNTQTPNENKNAMAG